MRRLAVALAVACATLSTNVAQAHFLWVKVEPAAKPGGAATVRIFLNETPEPGGPEFLKYVKGVVPTVHGLPLAVTPSKETVDAPWVGKLPTFVDAERDLGVKAKGETSYRLHYTARAQNGPVKADDKETATGLRVRVLARGETVVLQALFEGKPAGGVRLKAYPETGEPVESTADAEGLATIPGLAEGKTSLWANWVEKKPGESAGKAFSETRYYASLTFLPAAAVAKESTTSTAFATMPDPAVNSFGGAVLGDWLYVYGGHTGVTHKYTTETTSKHFRRLNLRDRTTWEDLPMGPAVQGVALVAGGKAVYRLGGMAPRNKPGEEHDLVSSADFARFDPETKVWTALAPLPKPRSTHDAAVIGRKIYAVGGWSMDGADGSDPYCDDAVVFDLDAPESGWKSFPQPFHRRALAVAALADKLYVLGGLNDDSKVERTVDVFDSTNGTWSRGPDLLGSDNREGFAASGFAIDGRLYYSGLAGTITRLDAPGSSWQVVGAWSLPRNTHRLLPGPKGTLLAVGGKAGKAQTPVIEAVTPEAVGALPTLTGR